MISNITQKKIVICPANQEIPYSFNSTDKGKLVRGYISIKICKDCTLKSQCTTSKARRIMRWIHEDRLEIMEYQLQSMQDIMKLRVSTVEYPFGTIKSWMGTTHFLTKRLKNVSMEMDLHVLAYNMKRMINIVGQQALINAFKAQ